MALVVEHILGKDEVSSSNLLSSSTRKPLKPLIFQVSAVFFVSVLLSRKISFFLRTDLSKATAREPAKVSVWQEAAYGDKSYTISRKWCGSTCASVHNWQRRSVNAVSTDTSWKHMVCTVFCRMRQTHCTAWVENRVPFGRTPVSATQKYSNCIQNPFIELPCCETGFFVCPFNTNKNPLQYKSKRFYRIGRIVPNGKYVVKSYKNAIIDAILTVFATKSRPRGGTSGAGDWNV